MTITTLEDFRRSSMTQDLYKEALEKGLAQGFAQGFAQRRLEALRGIGEKQVAKSFPELVPLLSLSTVKDPAVLDTVFAALVDARSAQQARQVLAKAKLLRRSTPRRTL